MTRAVRENVSIKRVTDIFEVRPLKHQTRLALQKFLLKQIQRAGRSPRYRGARIPIVIAMAALEQTTDAKWLSFLTGVKEEFIKVVWQRIADDPLINIDVDEIAHDDGKITDAFSRNAAAIYGIVTLAKAENGQITEAWSLPYKGWPRERFKKAPVI